jgi:hypothetical protein
VPGGGAADRRVWPINGAGEHGARVRGPADAHGPAREEKEMAAGWTVLFWICLNQFEII